VPRGRSSSLTTATFRSRDVRVTAGASGPVGDGALVQVDDLTINNEVIDFS
jgi:hypothetical protein